MLAFIRGLPRIVDRFVAHLETPAVVDLLYRVIQCEEAVPNAGIVDWLSGQDLIIKVVDLLSPSHSTDLHNTVSELLKAIIALSAPSPATLTQAQAGAEAFGFGGGSGTGSDANIGGVNNRLVRELASEATVRKMVSFMLDASLPSRLTRRLSEAADEQLATLSLGSLPDRAEASTFRKPSRVAARNATLGALTENAASSGSEESAVEDEEDDDESLLQSPPSRTPLNPRDTPASESRSPASHDHRDSTATIRPTNFFPSVKAPQISVTPESCTSSLVTCIGVLIELIRKNNSDYFEQHLFHTLRTHLLQRQQEIAEKRAMKRAEEKETSATGAGDESGAAANSNDDRDEEEEEMEGMEEAMAELSDKLGVVHLGPMLRVVCERLPDLQQLIHRPRTTDGELKNSLGVISALTFERYRITELYAELLHCSNMALLNRATGEGPQYSSEGALQGGIEGLQILARTLQGNDAASESDENEDESRRSREVTARLDDVEGEANAEESTEQAQTAVQNDAVSQQMLQEPPRTSRNSSKDSRHRREASSTQQSISSQDENDDEALLSEVSLGNGAGGAQTEEAKEKQGPFKDEGGNGGGNKDEDDAQSIRSVLSSLSLADLTSPAPSGPPSPIDDSKEYVVGDLLKKRFLQCDVIPTILEMFFEYPWNNFLHNVVYDILQQFFNGRMDAGLNRRLTLAVFEAGRLTDKILEGHKRNDESMKGPRRIRMGYMGHMNLIAEETVKLLERYPHEIGNHIRSNIHQPEWDQFVNESLRESREREAAPLAGGRPQMGHGLLSFSGLGGGAAAAGVAQQMQQEASLEEQESAMSGGDENHFASYLSSQMGAAGRGNGREGGSGAGEDEGDDDDDDEADSSGDDDDIGFFSNRHSGPPKDISSDTGAASASSGFDDTFTPSSHAPGQGHQIDVDDDDDDDEWGPFSDGFAATPSSSAPAPHEEVSSSADAYIWPSDSHPDKPPSEPYEEAVVDDEEEEDESKSPLDGLEGVPDGADVIRAAHAKRPSLGQHEAPKAALSLLNEDLRRKRSASQSGRDGPGEGTGSTLAAAASSAATSASVATVSSSPPGAGFAVDSQEPLGPGVSPHAGIAPDGLVERDLGDGTKVVVPLDDVALAAAASGSSATTTDDQEQGERQKQEDL